MKDDITHGLSSCKCVNVFIIMDCECVRLLPINCVSLQEEEERFRPGTNKAVSLQVLKDAGIEGMSLGEIMDVSQSRGLKDWEPGAKRILQFVSHPSKLYACIPYI